MKKLLAWILIMVVPAAVWAYKAPVNYAKVSDRVFINAGQEVELPVKILPDGTVNPDFVIRRNSDCRVYLKDKDTFRILAEINGTIIDNPLATGTASCAVNKRQSVLVRTRLEEPSNEPIEPKVLEIKP